MIWIRMIEAYDILHRRRTGVRGLNTASKVYQNLEMILLTAGVVISRLYDDVLEPYTASIVPAIYRQVA